MEYRLEDFRNKNIYLAPFNSETQLLANYLDKYGINFIKYLDNNKKGTDIIHPLDLYKDKNNLVIMSSPNYWKEILPSLLDEAIIFALSIFNNEYIFLNQEKYTKYLNYENIEENEIDEYLYKFCLNTYTYLTYPRISNMLHHTEEYDRLLALYKNFIIKENDNIIDIGAHHGSISLRFASLGAQVHAYEANPINMKILQKNILLNPQLKIKAYNKAVCDCLNTVKFNFGESSTTGSLDYLDFDIHTLEKECKTKIVEIKTISLNSILNSFDNIKLLKIDCEGCEYEILQSVSIENIKKVQYMLIEAHSTKYHIPNDLIDILKRNGFEYYSQYASKGCLEFICRNINYIDKDNSND